MIVIVRHGQTVWNKQKRKQGQSDSPLTLKGIEQAKDIASYIKKSNFIDVNDFEIYSSPLFRTMQFASIFLEEMNIENEKGTIQTNDLLKEHSFGLWEGLTETEIESDYPGFLKARYANWWDYIVPQGEGYNLISMRANKVLEEFKERNVIIFTHEMISKVIRGAYTGMNESDILSLDHPQDTIYILESGKATPVKVSD
ncbi:phosphoglycerate mutase family protein [Vibrio sp. ZSDE26]|uniref:Phosphoglycerate mutase family protein n=1 Tax=Vibrio amylolyticus TaxID=2847292 RepID=A0A9X1XIW9_9VIBR|nr:histidine phosphatase family protein [Vibrio amylolyticus]MCK6263246.1 phosphoglycerate mutase family protein [Vibrio amylolyticus]